MAPPRTISPRVNTTQQVDFVRESFRFGDQPSQMVASIPKDSVILDVSFSVTTPFNGGTNAVSLGITPGGNELMGTGDNTPGTVGLYRATKGLGTALTQNPTQQNAIGDAEGGVGVFITYAQTGAAATAGLGVAVVTYVPPSATNAV